MGEDADATASDSYRCGGGIGRRHPTPTRTQPARVCPNSITSPSDPARPPAGPRPRRRPPDGAARASGPCGATTSSKSRGSPSPSNRSSHDTRPADRISQLSAPTSSTWPPTGIAAASSPAERNSIGARVPGRTSSCSHSQCGWNGSAPGPRRDPRVTPQAGGAGLAQRAHELIPDVAGHVPPPLAGPPAQAVGADTRLSP